jgi:hypothetical protein
MSPNRSALTGAVRIFWDEMDKLGATMEGNRVFPTHEWEVVRFNYRVTRNDGSQLTGSLPWDIDTYSNLLKVAKGEA